jgi:hypothetical protein
MVMKDYSSRNGEMIRGLVRYNCDQRAPKINANKTIHIFPQIYPLLALPCRLYNLQNFVSSGRSSMLFATVSRGRNAGTRLLPHRFKDNRFHVHLGKDGPYIPITDYRDIPSYLANGYSLQMSNKSEIPTPSLIRPESIRGWRTDFRGTFIAAR